MTKMKQHVAELDKHRFWTQGHWVIHEAGEGTRYLRYRVTYLGRKVPGALKPFGSFAAAEKFCKESRR